MAVVPPTYRPASQAAGEEKIFLSGSTLNIKRPLQALASQLRDSRYDFLLRPGPWCPKATLTDRDAQPEADLDGWLAAWIGDVQPLLVLDLSGVPTEILSHVVGAIVRIIFDALFWGRHLPEGGRERPVLLVLEEAHAYLQSSEGGPALSAVQRVVKEGRKYGLCAMLVSQRPSEIDETILTQCGTFVAMRMTSTQDRAKITRSVSDHLEGLLDMLPALRTGEAIIVGEAVQVPLRVVVDLPTKERRPDSEDPYVVDVRNPAVVGWNRPRHEEDYGLMVSNWRREGAYRG